jgi:protein-disulfide isomerase
MSPLIPPVNDYDHAIGRVDAPVTLVEYGDFACPHCGRAYPLIQDVQRSLGDDLRFVFRHFPLSRIHPHAEHAAEIAEAAATQGKFWDMHGQLFEHQDALADEDLIRYAEVIGLDPREAAIALADGRYRDAVREDFAGGVRSGVNGTPTFFINSQRYDGPWDELLETLTVASQS